MNLKDNILSKILEFNKELNSYEYGLPKHREKNKKYNSYKESNDNQYHILYPSQFEAQRGGICWDFVTYQAERFKKIFSNVKFKTYYIVFDIPPYYPTHTFLVFKYNENYYYFESSFVKYQGVYLSKSLKDIFNFILYNMGNYKDNEDTKKIRKHCENNSYNLYEYNALDSRIPGSSASEFMTMIEKYGNPINHKFSKSFNVQKITDDYFKESSNLFNEINKLELEYIKESFS